MAPSTQDSQPDPLRPEHRRELEIGSGIDPRAIARRGYRSVTATEGEAMGFAPSQCRRGWFAPTCTLAGAQVGGFLKPDEPRTLGTRTLKYGWPAGLPPILDCHPGALATVKAGGPQWFSEGVKKIDSAWSRGLAVVSVHGTWGFLRGRVIVPDLDELPLYGEDAFICFDSDVTRHASVAEALIRLAEALRRRGAKVWIVSLPHQPNGDKTGLDDFFVGGGTVPGLMALAQPWDGHGLGLRWRTLGPSRRAAGPETVAGMRAHRFRGGRHA
jgi:hypothetical protein